MLAEVTAICQLQLGEPIFQLLWKRILSNIYKQFVLLLKLLDLPQPFNLAPTQLQ